MFLLNRTLFINVLVFGVMGFALATEGYNFMTFEFWYIILSMTVIQINNAISE